MTAKTVKLHGGPYHGQVVSIPDHMDHLHVAGVSALSSEEEDPPTIDVREGTYSQVSGPANRHNFEWDGWVTH